MIRWRPWEGGGLELPYLFQRKLRKEKNKRRRKVRKFFVLVRGGLVDTPPSTDATWRRLKRFKHFKLTKSCVLPIACLIKGTRLGLFRLVNRIKRTNIRNNITHILDQLNVHSDPNKMSTPTDFFVHWQNYICKYISMYSTWIWRSFLSKRLFRWIKMSTPTDFFAHWQNYICRRAMAMLKYDTLFLIGLFLWCFDRSHPIQTYYISIMFV